ncbi:MAG TPA: aspartyl protease family protein [Caulobacteraceae bacterium]|jgi:predicted aspartyl protease|nr:aspartyl protease family protein [Caulobacteraceae bacterium]
MDQGDEAGGRGGELDRRRLALLIGAAALAPVAARADILERLQTGTRIPKFGAAAAYVPPTSVATVADIYRRMTAAVMVNGHGPYPFVVDTGANQSVLSADIAAQLALPVGPPRPLNGVAGVQIAPTVTATLAIGERVHRDVELSVLPGEALGGAGLLGLDRLDGQRLTLDFGRQTLRIEDSHAWRDPEEITVKAHRRDGQLTLVKADLAGIPLVAFLDSGAQNTIGNQTLRRLALTRNPKTLWIRTPIVSATGQTIDAEIADLPALRIGGLRLPNWPVAFADLHTFRLWNLIDQPAILVGVDVMSRFEHVSLDFARDEVRFRLPKGS